MAEISKITGREYKPFTYYGAPDADRVIILMGSASEAAREAIDFMAKQGQKVGLVSVHLYRPFSVERLLAAVPKTVKAIAVLDRTKEPGADGEPLYLDVKAAFYGQPNAPVIVGGRYGLGSADTTPTMITRHKVYTETELHARYEIKLDNYSKVLHIEAQTMLDMVWKDILPAASAYTKELAETVAAKKSRATTTRQLN